MIDGIKGQPLSMANRSGVMRASGATILIAMIRFLTAGLALIAVQNPLQAKVNDLSQSGGVWSGTIGTYPVRACLEPSGLHVNGGYYYMSHLVPIALHGGAADLLVERDRRNSGPEWHLEPPLNGEIHGHWRDGAKDLLIRLHKDVTAFGQPCAGRAFLGPLVAPIHWDSKAVQFGKTSYIRRDLVSPPSFGKALLISVVQLDASRPGDEQINASLLEEEKPWGLDGWAGCFGEALAMGTLGDYKHSEEPILLGANIVSLRMSDGSYCGGAHPNAGYSYTNFERMTGHRIDVRGWFRAGTIILPESGPTDPEPVNQIAPIGPLRETILAHIPVSDAECREDLAENLGGGWWVGVSPNGLVFAPEVPHVMEACETEITLPFADLASYLTPQALISLSGHAR